MGWCGGSIAKPGGWLMLKLGMELPSHRFSEGLGEEIEVLRAGW